MLQVYTYTLSIAFFSTIIAFFFGFICAYFTSHKNFVGRKLILSLYIIPLCLPPLIIALGYVNFFGVNGSVNSFFGTNFSFLYSSVAIVIAQGFYNLPFVTKILNDAWLTIPKETTKAARMLGAKEGRIFFTITIKELSGAICASVIPVFLFCFFSFLIVILFSPAGKSTMEVELYRMVRSSLDFSSGYKIVLLETFTALVIVLLYSFFTKKEQVYNNGMEFLNQGDSSPGTFFRINQGDSSLSTKWTYKEKFIFIVLMLLVLFFLICPLISVIKASFTQKLYGKNVFSFSNYSSLFKNKGFYVNLKNSFLFSSISSFFCCTISFLYSSIIRITKKQSNIVLSTIPLIPMAISSVAISFVSSMIFHSSNIVLLVVLQVIMFWPLSYRQIQNTMNKITKETQNAALLLSKNKMNMLLRIYLPTCKNVIVSSFCLNFAICIGDTTIPLVLSIRGFSNLALQTYRLSGSYRFNGASACAVLIIMSGIIFSLLVTLFLRFGRKLVCPSRRRFYNH